MLGKAGRQRRRTQARQCSSRQRQYALHVAGLWEHKSQRRAAALARPQHADVAPVGSCCSAHHTRGYCNQRLLPASQTNNIVY